MVLKAAEPELDRDRRHCGFGLVTKPGAAVHKFAGVNRAMATRKAGIPFTRVCHAALWATVKQNRTQHNRTLGHGIDLKGGKDGAERDLNAELMRVEDDPRAQRDALRAKQSTVKERKGRYSAVIVEMEIRRRRVVGVHV